MGWHATVSAIIALPPNLSRIGMNWAGIEVKASRLLLRLCWAVLWQFTQFTCVEELLRHSD